MVNAGISLIFEGKVVNDLIILSEFLLLAFNLGPQSVLTTIRSILLLSAVVFFNF